MKQDDKAAPARALGDRSACTPLWWAFALLVIALVATSQPARVGDGREYLAVALNLARFDPPALSAGDMVRAEKRLDQWGFGGLPLAEHAELTDARGRQDFFHFWLYPALAAPFVRLALALRVHPNYGFVALNVALFLAALVVVSKRVAWPFAAALFCSPALWWIDKAHTEVFTFSLLAIAFARLEDAPWWSMICLAAAAAQNPPIAVLFVCVALLAPVLRPGAWRMRRFQAGALAALAVALLHPVYYGWRWGLLTPQLLLGTAVHVPSVQEMGAVVWDPNVGFVFAAPLLAATVAAAGLLVVVRERTRLMEPGVWLALAGGFVFLASFAQATNVNSGATPGMSRYALWLLPLALPIFRAASAAHVAAPRRWLTALALASCAWSVVAFHPRQPERYLAPSLAANVLWTHWPSLDNPLPEIFAERASGDEPATLPVATGGCTKVLLREGRWPGRCNPRPVVPPSCQAAGTFCYANRSDAAYDFVPVAPARGYTFGPDR
jgi:hypothetical protein